MPPLGLFYLVSVLKQCGIKAQICDLGLGEELPGGNLYITGTTPQEKEILALQSDSYTVLGGPHASIDHENLKDKFSLVVRGEAEKVIEFIVRNKPKGFIHAKRIVDLDSLPFPDRTTAHKYDYRIDGKKATTAISSRGCTGRCSFCSRAVMGRGVYLRSAENVVAELREIKELGFEAVMFYDDTIAIEKFRLRQICHGLLKLGLTWRCFVRADQVNQEILNVMGQCGCHEILIGVESGSQKILDNIRKGETVEQNRRAILMMREAGIRSKASIIVGLPGESWETIEETRRFIEETQPDETDICILSVYKGTDIWKNPDKYELTFTESTWYKGRNGEYLCNVRTPYMTEQEILQARTMLAEVSKRH
jgi:anaerobic magnesium-protoporphyrin IX monomethyl ester cyclase